MKCHRQDTENFGAFEFKFAEDYKYPLIYVRSSGEQEILVAINPSGREACCRIEQKVSEMIYHQGGEPVLQEGILCMPACSAAFYRV